FVGAGNHARVDASHIFTHDLDGLFAILYQRGDRAHVAAQNVLDDLWVLFGELSRRPKRVDDERDGIELHYRKASFFGDRYDDLRDRRRVNLSGAEGRQSGNRSADREVSNVSV